MLKQALEDNAIHLNPRQINALSAYLAQLNHWNKAFNLTAIIDPEEQIYKHILDSLSIIPYIYGEHIADVGTGAGLPGIPLSIALPLKKFTLIDSQQKRIIFLQQVITKLALPQVVAQHQRIETFAPSALFDCLISRAFSSLADFADKTRHLLNPGGQLLAMKGNYPEDEIKKLPQDFQLIDVRELTVFGLHAKRHLVILEKR